MTQPARGLRLRGRAFRSARGPGERCTVLLTGVWNQCAHQLPKSLGQLKAMERITQAISQVRVPNQQMEAFFENT